MASRLPKSTIEKMALCQHIIGYRFINPGLLQNALSSSKHQRLGMLGDLLVRVAIMDRWYDSEKLTPNDWGSNVGRCLSNANLSRIGFRKGLSWCIISPGVRDPSVLPEKGKLIADTVEAILGAVYKDAAFPHPTTVPSEAPRGRGYGLQVLEEVVDRLGITHQLLVTHSSRAWTQWKVGSTRVLGADYFDGRHRQFMTVMDHLSDKDQPIRLPRDWMGRFTGELPLNDALVIQRGPNGPSWDPPVPRQLGVWDRLYEKLWGGRPAEPALWEKPQKLRRLNPNSDQSPPEPADLISIDDLAEEQHHLGEKIEKQNAVEEPEVAPTLEPGSNDAVVPLAAESRLVGQNPRASTLERELDMYQEQAELGVPSTDTGEGGERGEVAEINHLQASSPAGGASPTAQPTQVEATEVEVNTLPGAITFEDFMRRTVVFLLPLKKKSWEGWLERLAKTPEPSFHLIGGNTKALRKEWYERAKDILNWELREDDGTFESFVRRTLPSREASIALDAGQDRWAWVEQQHEIFKKAQHNHSLPKVVGDAGCWYAMAKKRLFQEGPLEAYVRRTIGRDKLPFSPVADRLADPDSDWDKILLRWRSNLESQRQKKALPGHFNVDKWMKEAEMLLKSEIDRRGK